MFASPPHVILNHIYLPVLSAHSTCSQGLARSVGRRLNFLRSLARILFLLAPRLATSETNHRDLPADRSTNSDECLLYLFPFFPLLLLDDFPPVLPFPFFPPGSSSSTSPSGALQSGKGSALAPGTNSGASAALRAKAPGKKAAPGTNSLPVRTENQSE